MEKRLWYILGFFFIITVYTCGISVYKSARMSFAVKHITVKHNDYTEQHGLWQKKYTRSQFGGYRSKTIS